MEDEGSKITVYFFSYIFTGVRIRTVTLSQYTEYRGNEHVKWWSRDVIWLDVIKYLFLIKVVKETVDRTTLN